MVNFLKLGFSLVSECEIFAHGDQIHIFLDREGVANIPTLHMPKHSCMTHRKLFLMHGFHSIPRVGIQQVSLKSCRRWDSMCNKMMVVAQIDEPSNPLDLGHQDSAKGGPLLWVYGHGIFFWSILETRVFLSKGM